MQQDVTPEPILQLLSGFMAAQHLMVSSEVGLFEQLGGGEATLDDLATRTGLPWRSARILADAMVAFGLLEKSGGTYRNTPASYTFLSGETPADLRPLLRMSHKVQYEGWAGLEKAIREGGATAPVWFDDGGEAQRIMSEGIEAESTGTAMALASTYDFSDRHHLVDIAGGTGNYIRVLLEHYPHLEATLFELPAVAAMARERLDSLVQAGRARVVEGDVFTDPLPGGDVVLMSHIIHAFVPDRNTALLRRMREAVEPGARLLIVDFWTNAGHTDPPFAALIAGEFYRTIGGDVYSVDEAREWLVAAGWRFVGHRPLNGPTSIVEAEAA
ncbi:MAG: methyltransferase [Dehalococcoidia bacterium]|nr:methyltransferase [Dehalococcoidia bacterium]